MTSAPRKGFPLKPPENYWSFVPISPEAHEAAFQAAAQSDMPLNAWLSQLIKYVGEMEQTETGETAGSGGDLAAPEPEAASGQELNGSGPEAEEAGAEYREVEIQVVESTRRKDKRPPTAEISHYEPLERATEGSGTDDKTDEGSTALAESGSDAPPPPPEFTAAEDAGPVETPEFTGEGKGDEAAPIHGNADTERADFDDSVDGGEADDDDELLDLTPDQIAEGPGPEPEEQEDDGEEAGPAPEAAPEAEAAASGEAEAGEIDRSRVQPRRQFSAHVAGRPSGGQIGDAGVPDAADEPAGGASHPPALSANEAGRRAAAGDTDEVSSGPILVPASRLRPSQMKLEAKPDEREIQAALNILSETGSLQAIIVRPVADAGSGDGGEDADATYEIVYGETRWRAALRSRMDEVPVLVRRLTDQEALIYSVRESLVHRALSPLAEAGCYQRLKDQFGLNDEDLGPAVGKSPEHVADILRFLDLPAAVRRMMEDGSISAIHARALLTADDPEAAAAEVVRRGLDIFQTEQLVRNANNGVRLGTAETD